MGKKLTPGGNWMFEDSRMIMPEHKHALNAHAASLGQRERVVLTEEEWEAIGHVIEESRKNRSLAWIKLYDPRGELTIVGVVESVRHDRGRFLVMGRWYDIRDIEGAAIES